MKRKKKNDNVFLWSIRKVFLIDKKIFCVWIFLAFFMSLINGVEMILSARVINNLVYRDVVWLELLKSITLWQLFCLVLVVYSNIDEMIEEILLTNFGPKIQKMVINKSKSISLRTMEKAEYQKKYSKLSDYKVHRLTCFFAEFARLIASIFNFIVVLIFFGSINYWLLFYCVLLVGYKIVRNKKMAMMWIELSDEIDEISMKENYYYRLMGCIWNVKEIRMLGLKEFVKKRWKGFFDDLFFKRYNIDMMNQKTFLVFGILDNAMSAIVCAVFVVLLFNQKILIGTFLVGLSIVSFANNSVIGVFVHFERMCSFFSDIKGQMDYFRMYEEENGLVEKKEERIEALNSEECVIKMEDLSYRYTPTEKVLDNINLSLYKGRIVAFVGENGSGKSTLVKILLGMYRDYEGKVYYNNLEYNELAPAFLSSHIGVTMQKYKTYMFTIRENIGMGAIDFIYQDDMIWKALKKADADGIVRREANSNLDKKIIKWFNDDAIDLSIGQQQRLAVSRAYLGEKDVIVLDEPAAALDPIAEYRQFERIRNKAKDTTAIIISHRIGFARMADVIVVFKEGKIVENGTHEKLLSLKGEYWRLFSAQSKWYSKENMANASEGC